MEITLSDNTEIKILLVDIFGNKIDWQRKEGYLGVCTSKVTFTSFSTLEADIISALESELNS
jgi:hypothetical protein